MCSNNVQKHSSQRVIRITKVITIYFIKLFVNLGLVLGFLFLTFDVNSKLFSAITFLLACLFDIAMLFSLNVKMGNKTRIIQMISIMLIIIVIGYMIFSMIKNLLGIQTGNIHMFSINVFVSVIGIYSTIMEIICNIPIDD